MSKHEEKRKPGRPRGSKTQEDCGSETKKTKQYLFTIENIDIKIIEKKYGIILESNINTNAIIPTNTTKISELSSHKQTPISVSFLDESKKKHTCVVSMIDFKSGQDTSNLTYDCFWDRHPIPNNIEKLGCPIRYVANEAVKTYYSEISKDTYTIKQKITNKILEQIQKDDYENIKINTKNYYVTDKVFCSFNCCLAFIRNNKHNSIYDMSEMLLMKMYDNIYPDNNCDIVEAPSFEILSNLGGTVSSIEEFREDFNNIEYENHGKSFPRIEQKSLVTYFEKKIKF